MRKANKVYFTLADGTIITIAKGGATSDEPSTGFIFYVTYDANGGVGTMDADTFYYSYEGAISACEYSREGYRFVNWNTSADGTGVPFQAGYTLTLDRHMKLYAQWQEVGLVDMGLSVKWAGCNIGANTPEEFGDYFAWGEVEPKTEYSLASYLFSTGNDYTALTKYNSSDKLTELVAADDAATVNWGGEWRMPTQTEWNELKTKCTWTRTTTGYRVTASNGNSIFLPYAGYKNDQGVQYADMAGYYWTSTLSSESVHSAYYWWFRKSGIEKFSNNREWGLSIRPVCS